MTQTIDARKTKSHRTATKCRRAAAPPPPPQARKRVNPPPGLPAIPSHPQPRVPHPPRPNADEPGSGTRPTIPPRTRSATPAVMQPGMVQPPDPAIEEPSATPTTPLNQGQALQELVRRANEGNATCLAGMRQLLDDNPEIWQQAGDVASLATRSWIELMAAGNKLAEESIPRRLRAMKAELTSPHPTALERLLIDVIGVSWLAAMHGEVVAAQSGGSIQQAAFRQRRAESCQRRLLRAMKTLEMVRALSAKTRLKKTKRR
jgi:hypothetical protein